jgi:hypothetical protein
MASARSRELGKTAPTLVGAEANRIIKEMASARFPEGFFETLFFLSGKA